MSRERVRREGPVTPAPEPVDACCGAPVVGGPQDPLERGDLMPWWQDPALRLPVASGVLWVVGLLLGLADQGLVGLIAYVLGLAAGAWTFVPGAVRRLVGGRGQGRLGVALLMTIAAAGAVLLGHVGEAAALAFLFSVAEALEDRAMHRARHGLRSLLSLIPDTARILAPGGLGPDAPGDPGPGAYGSRTPRVVPVAEVRVGDRLLVGAGERVATDGVVVGGRSWADTSAITGESIPVAVSPGDAVLAGSVNGSGTLTLEATADGRDSSLTQIVHLIEQAHAAKGGRARLADQIARPLVPLVLVAAVAVALYGVLVGDPGTWVERALVVLVAASPCALAIAVPVTVISSIGAASRLGVVIRSGAAFEQLGTVRTVALDKTGTLTQNRPQVVAVHTADGFSREQVLDLAAALEASSSHPLADALVAAAPERPTADDVHEHPGQGLSGTVVGRSVRVGSPRWVDPGPLSDHVRRVAADGMSVVLVEVEGRQAGVIGVRDELRPEAAETVSALHAQGITTVMLTGDNDLTAQALAAEAGIDRVHSEQLPADKAAHVRALSGQAPTAMIGDGINDAPALASATVGIAMGAAGSAAAVESADVAFTGSDLRLIPAALAHARRGRRIMTGNIVLALAIIIVLFPLALTGVLGLAAVVLVHEAAEVVVIANGLRAARARRPDLTPVVAGGSRSLPPMPLGASG